MKSLLIAILERVPATEGLIRDLSKQGYNGTVINADGLHHVLPKLTGQSTAVSLSSIVDDAPRGTITLFIVVDEERKEDLKALLREATDSFHAIPGGMVVYPLADVEGFYEHP